MMEEIQVDFGRNLKVLRVYRGLTQEELARRLSVAQATVWEWEHNVSRPRDERLTGLCRELKCKPEALHAPALVTLAVNTHGGQIADN